MSEVHMIGFDGNKYEFLGTLAGVVGSARSWSFEGVEYDTPATADDLDACSIEAMAPPDEAMINRADGLVFGPGANYTSQALLAIMVAYEREVGNASAGVPQVLAILQDAARRIACIEALTI